MNSPMAVKRGNQSLEAALQDAETRYIAANPKSAALNAESRAHLPGGNTRTTVHFSPFPLYIDRGEGSRLTDADGHVYSDFVNEYTAGVFGHSNPVIREAIAGCLADGLNFGAPTRYEVLLSAEIRRRFPAMELMRFCNSGTEANLLAVATARAATGRQAVLAFDGAYHGSLLYFSHGASPLNMPVLVHLSPFNDPERAARDIAEHAGRLAAVIVEPMQGGAGALPAAAEFMATLRRETERHGVLLILDEVMTSRVHHGGLQAYFGIRPDLVTLGKYIGGGLTIGAFGGRHDLMARFDPARPDAFPHGGTFNNNVLAMAAGHAALTRLLTPEATVRMNALGDDLRRRLNSLAQELSMPVVATGFGSIFGIHFHRGRAASIGDLDAFETGRQSQVAALKKLFHLDMFEAGIYISRRIMGNLSLETSQQETDSLVGAVEEFLRNRGPLLQDALG
jgi:glutamate-1-semialdehyde 2,1-aminomutase